MTTITATSSAAAFQRAAAAQAAAAAVAPPAPAGAAAPSEAPAVVVSIGKGTLSASAHPADATAEQRVASVVDDLKNHNDLADTIAHTDWSVMASMAGQEKADATRAEFEKSVSLSSAYVGRILGESGIAVREVTKEQAAAGGPAAGTLLLAGKGFSFRSGGSTYAVAAGEDGTLVGTRDGQAWKSWKITPTRIAAPDPSAAAALSALQTLLSPQASGTNGSASLVRRVV